MRDRYTLKAYLYHVKRGHLKFSFLRAIKCALYGGHAQRRKYVWF